MRQPGARSRNYAITPTASASAGRSRVMHRLTAGGWAAHARICACVIGCLLRLRYLLCSEARVRAAAGSPGLRRRRACPGHRRRPPRRPLRLGRRLRPACQMCQPPARMSDPAKSPQRFLRPPTGLVGRAQSTSRPIGCVRWIGVMRPRTLRLCGICTYLRALRARPSYATLTTPRTAVGTSRGAGYGWNGRFSSARDLAVPSPSMSPLTWRRSRSWIIADGYCSIALASV